MRSATFLLLAACSAPSHHLDIVAPFDGAIARYAVDSLQLPDQRSQFGDDLDGDGDLDNQMANLLGALESQGCSPLAPEDEVAIASVLEIQTADLHNDARAGVRYQGTDVANGDFVGGAFQGGVFVSNRTRETSHPANMTVRLPLFVDAPPIEVPLTGVEIDLALGQTGTLRGAIRKTDLVPLLVAGFYQSFDSNPGCRANLLSLFDYDHDGAISQTELVESSLFINLTNPDADLFDAQGSWNHDGLKESIGVAFGFHAR